MRHFENIDELHQYIEKKASRIIRHYYTDWKNYDRPAMMKATGEKTKEVYVILRECGSYFYTADDLEKSDYSATVMDYYTGDKTARYFRLNFKDLTAEAIPAGLPRHIKEAREEARKRVENAA